jgi:uncharacterized RDD family membrane protein YckC
MNYQEYLDQYIAYDPILVRRCFAATLDYSIFFLIYVIYVYFFGNVDEWGINDGKFSVKFDIGLFSFIFIWFLYFPVIESIYGYTLGKGLFDLKVIKENSNDSKFYVSFIRHLVDIIDFFLLGLVAILLVKYTKRHKRIGDLLADTIVVLDK